MQRSLVILGASCSLAFMGPIDSMRRAPLHLTRSTRGLFLTAQEVCANAVLVATLILVSRAGGVRKDRLRRHTRSCDTIAATFVVNCLLWVILADRINTDEAGASELLATVWLLLWLVLLSGVLPCICGAPPGHCNLMLNLGPIVMLLQGAAEALFPAAGPAAERPWWYSGVRDDLWGFLRDYLSMCLLILAGELPATPMPPPPPPPSPPPPPTHPAPPSLSPGLWAGLGLETSFLHEAAALSRRPDHAACGNNPRQGKGRGLFSLAPRESTPPVPAGLSAPLTVVIMLAHVLPLVLLLLSLEISNPYLSFALLALTVTLVPMGVQRYVIDPLAAPEPTGRIGPAAVELTEQEKVPILAGD